MARDAERRTLVVEPGAGGVRLDLWLALRLPDLSRSRIKSLVEAGDVLVAGRVQKPSARLRPGQEVSVRIPEPEAAVPQAQDLPIHVVYEDAHLLVVDKPAGMTVHPGAGRASGTLVNALLHHVKDLSGIGGVLRPGIVHRLDKGTSGLLVVAKDDPTHRALAEQFAARRVEKEYCAVVLGVPKKREGEISAAIGRDPTHRKKMSVRARRSREAKTLYRVEQALDGAALLRVRILTGRTHQIRVHLAWLGHPVAGDPTYGGGRTPPSRRSRSREALQALARPALHAAHLAFQHPVTGRRLAFDSPLPRDLRALLLELSPPA
jgi:23S rRNA pseudouridine1911/1915/1917 synthase